MARLSAESSWMIQQNDGMVTIFHEHTQEHLLQFNPGNANETAITQKLIHDLPQLNEEEKCFAHFWSGYFYAHSGAEFV
jgi:hypothetical protein